MSDTEAHRPYNVLFLCTGNSARSILAEVDPAQGRRRPLQCILRRQSSEGASEPIRLAHPQRVRLPDRGPALQSWSEFADPGMPMMDFVFTVCDDAAAEECPVWPGQPMSAHWGIEDPALVVGNDVVKEAAFAWAFRYMKNRINAFINLPIRSLDKLSLQTKVRDIGGLEGSTSPQSKAS